MKKRIQDEPEFKKGKEEAENNSHKSSERKGNELSPFLKSLQASKNNQK